ncbi:hypothetical protein BZZ01_28820 [Nostocales cyanobacterium HT-58-2]|nr:hypothetical protein BZZ01_28820 [Nostocales cyanobacterium HT-58-2]
MNWLTRRFFNYLVCLGLVISLILSPLFSSHVSSEEIGNSITKQEIRGVWLTNVNSGVLFAPWGINRALKQLSALKFNTVYPVVWNRGHTFYSSRIAKKEIGLDSQPLLKFIRGGGDILATITQLSAQKNLRVLPWFEYGFMLPSHSTLAKYHPDWLTVGLSGDKLIEEIPLDVQTKNSKQQFFRQRSVKKEVWLNALHPQVQEFIKSLILEVITHYNVDGIQLDDHFGMPVKLGYDSFTIQLYQQEHKGKEPPSDPFDSEWMRWRADKITHFMQEIVTSVKAVKPNAKISLAPNSYTFAYKHYLQDWETWVNRGLVDELILQVYRNDINSFQVELQQSAVQNARRKIPVGVGILTGTWGNPIDIKQIKEQVEIVRDRNFDGVSFFYWESLWGYITPESPRQRRKAFLEIFSA